MTTALKCRIHAQHGTLTKATGTAGSRIQATAGGGTTSGRAGQLTPDSAAPARQQQPSRSSDTGAPEPFSWGQHRPSIEQRYSSASRCLLVLVILLLGGAAAESPPPKAGCASSSTQHGGSATRNTAERTGGPLGVTGTCPVSLLNLLAVQRLVLSGIKHTTGGDAAGACGPWACGLVQSVLPAAIAVSRQAGRQSAGGPSAGSPSLGQAVQRSAVDSMHGAFAAQPADGQATADPGAAATAPVPTAGDRRDVETAVLQLIGACTGPLALQLALSVSEAAGPTEPSWRSPGTGQDGASAGGDGGSGLAAGIAEILQRMALCPLDTDVVAACLEAVPGSEPRSASVAAGLLGVGPDAASRVAPGAAAAAQLPSGGLASYVQQSTWLFSSERPLALYSHPQTCDGQPPQVSYKGPAEPQQQQAALGFDPGADLLGGGGGCVGGVAAAAPVTWTAGCACSRTWAPLCHVATGVQYPNRCYAACQGVDSQSVRPCLELFQPLAGLAVPGATGPAAGAPLTGVDPPSPSIPGDISSKSDVAQSGQGGDDARQVLRATFAATVGSAPHAGMQQSAEQGASGLQAGPPMSIFMASSSGSEQQQQQPSADLNPRTAPAGPVGSPASGPDAIGAAGADAEPGADDAPYEAGARVAALLLLLLLPAVQELGGQGNGIGNAALVAQPPGLGLDRTGASSGPGHTEQQGAAGIEGSGTTGGVRPPTGKGVDSGGDAVHSVEGGGDGQGVPGDAAPLDRLIYLLHLLLAAQKLNERDE